MEEEANAAEYDYLLGMPMWNLTLEKKEEALVEAVKGVKINEEEGTGKKTKAAEPGL